MTTSTQMLNDSKVSDLIEVQLKRRSQEFVNWQSLIADIPFNKTYEGAYVGTYSLALQKKKITYVDSRHDWCGKPVSASTISRLCLEKPLEALGRKRFFWTMKALPLLKENPPFYAVPGTHAHLVYADISSCYYDLYRRLPLYLYYFGLKPIYGNQTFEAYLPPDLRSYKLVRNSVVGTMRSFSSSRVRGGKIISTGNRNKFLMPCHWGCMTEILHHFARLALHHNCIYYNTDGAIFVCDEDAIKWIEDIAKWGFKCSIKGQGAGQVQGIGAYKVGGLGTITFGRKPKAYDNLKKPNKYVLDMFEKLAL